MLGGWIQEGINCCNRPKAIAYVIRALIDETKINDLHPVPSGQRPDLPLNRQGCGLHSFITRFPTMFILTLMKFSRRDSVSESIFYLVFNVEDSLELKLMFPQ